MYYANARSLLCQFKELEMLVRRKNYDVVAITETWLTDNTFVAEYHLPGYQVFSQHRKGSHGGGVLMYVKSAYAAEQLNINITLQSTEVIVCRLRNVLFLNIYRSPNTSVEHSNQLWEEIEKICLQTTLDRKSVV